MDYRDRWELKEYLLERRLERRILLFHAGAILLLLGYVLGFWYLQVVRGEEYARLAETNRLREVPLPPTRGVIYDRHGEIVASTRPSLRLLLRREGPEDRDAQLRRLQAVLEVPYASLLERLDQVQGHPAFEPAVLKDDVPLEQLAPIEARREWFPSVEFLQTARRTYPAGEIVSHVLGYVGEVSEQELASCTDGALHRGDIVGKAGIERSYDDMLRGQRGIKFVTVNSLGRQLGEGRSSEAPHNGQDLHLTLDLRLQKALVEALGDEVGAGVFLDPRTGEVLALASMPTYDPNVFAGRVSPEAWKEIANDPRQPLHNRAITSFYAPGSTFKVVMAIAGLETATIAPSTTFTCTGSAVMYGRSFLCWKHGGHGTIALQDALAHSCNVYFYNVGRALGIEAIHRYGDLLNLGRTTGIDLPGEAPGILPSDEWKRREHGEPWYPGETISVSIGQGLLAVTPIQMATMISGVATGKLPTPYLVEGHGTEPVDLHLAPRTLKVVRAALVQTVDAGTARRAQLGSITVAGKTGTAQVFKRSAGIDADKLPKEERDHAWFVGYAPAENPEIAFAVVIEHGGHGGTTAAPVAREVLEVHFAGRLGRQPEPGLRAGSSRPRGEVRAAAPSTR